MTKTEKSEKIEKPNDIFIPQIIKLLDEGHTVTISLKGYSMRPFLQDRRDKALLKGIKYSDGMNVNDVVLAFVYDARYVLHRIVKIDGDMVILRGDGNLNTEVCRVNDVKAKAIGFYRNGSDKMDSTQSLKWRLYSALWTQLYPIRRYLLFALRFINL